MGFIPMTARHRPTPSAVHPEKVHPFPSRMEGVAMATITEDDLAVPIERDAVIRRAGRRSRFYLGLALACALIAIGGFAPSYWLQLPRGTFVGPPLLHIHGILTTAWILFLISQTWLMSNGRTRSHKDWGLAGISLATAVVLVGIIVAITGMEGHIAQGHDNARSFLIVPLAAIFRFALFTGAAVAFVHNPDWHKRLMIVGTISLIEAAAARFGFLMAVGTGPGVRPGLLPPPPQGMPVVVGLLLQLLIVAGMIHDKRTRGRVHPAWIVGMAVSVAIIVLKVPFSTTSTWLAFADWTTRIAS